MRLEETVAIITGAKSGIGLATAQLFGAEGAKVVLADIRDADEEVREITEGGGEALFVQADVSSESQVSALVETTLDAYARLDVVVNNAGIELAEKVTDTTEAEWDRVMDVNLKGVFLCSRAAIPVMQRQGGGVIGVHPTFVGRYVLGELTGTCATNRWARKRQNRPVLKL